MCVNKENDASNIPCSILTPSDVRIIFDILKADSSGGANQSKDTGNEQPFLLAYNDIHTANGRVAAKQLVAIR